MKVECEQCNGSGKVSAPRVEDSYICCEGHQYYCDSCEDELTEDEVQVDIEDEHFCATCACILGL